MIECGCVRDDTVLRSGASGYHWRYNIPELAKTCRVFAIDLLGFGWSDKPLVEYNGYGVWGDQLAAFLTEVVGEPAVLVGNSLGEFRCRITMLSFSLASLGLNRSCNVGRCVAL